jgi:hypothetical protein
MHDEIERRRAKLVQVGGSRSVILPKAWLDDLRIDDDSVDLVRTRNGITVEAPLEADASIEEDPAFPAFLDFLAHSALVHPQELVSVADLTADDEDLVAGVELDD